MIEHFVLEIHRRKARPVTVSVQISETERETRRIMPAEDAERRRRSRPVGIGGLHLLSQGALKDRLREIARMAAGKDPVEVLVLRGNLSRLLELLGLAEIPSEPIRVEV